MELWRCATWKVAVACFGLGLALASPAYPLTLKTTTGLSSGINWGGGGPAYFAQVFGNFGAGFVGPLNGPAALKGSATSTSATGPLNGPAGSGAFVQNTVNSAGSLGVFTASNTWTMTVGANRGNLPKTSALGRYIDPFNAEISTAGPVVTGTQGLLSGSQVEEPDPTALVPIPSLVLEGRFGIGNFPADDPSLLWPDSSAPPTGAFDLFNITVSVNSSDMIDAVVQLFSSPNSVFTLSFNTTAADIEAEIDNADWIKSGGIFTLQDDLSLLSVTVTKLTTTSAESAALGFRGTLTTNGVPEPASVTLLAAGILGLLGCCWARQRGIGAVGPS